MSIKTHSVQVNSNKRYGFRGITATATTTSGTPIEILLVAGGGGGGNKRHAGGGAGGVLYYGATQPGIKSPNGAALSFSANSQYTITIGNGGATSGYGGNTVFAGDLFTITAVGGMGSDVPPGSARGGSGCGTGPGHNAASPVDYYPTQGNIGGAGATSSGTRAYGGGGGAGAVGGDAHPSDRNLGGAGGDGVQYPEYSWVGPGMENGYFGGGGGGGGDLGQGVAPFAFGLGGKGGGGSSARGPAVIGSGGSAGQSFNGNVNTGGGAGGQGDLHPLNGGGVTTTGGSGIAIISYPGSSIRGFGGNPNIFARTGYVTHVFTGTNTFVWLG
jgi:hypothetical protein